MGEASCKVANHKQWIAGFDDETIKLVWCGLSLFGNNTSANALVVVVMGLCVNVA